MPGEHAGELLFHLAPPGVALHRERPGAPSGTFDRVHERAGLPYPRDQHPRAPRRVLDAQQRRRDPILSAELEEQPTVEPTLGESRPHPCDALLGHEEGRRTLRGSGSHDRGITA